YRGGVRVAVGDVTGDGIDDIVTAPGPGVAPVVKVFDGASGQQVAGFVAYDNFLGGAYVAVGDVNGDGFADIITGAGAGGGPHVKAFSGVVMGQQMLSFMAYASTYTGGVYVTAGDVDGDGKAEVVAGSGGRGLMQTKLFDDDGRLLRTFDVAGQNSPLS